MNYLELKKILPKKVNLLAVSKGFKSADIEYIHLLGQNDFGESKLQEALSKSIFRNNRNLHWHFIGRIQTNKIKKIVENRFWGAFRAHSDLQYDFGCDFGWIFEDF